MKIVKLTIENIMRISAVEITPEGAVVVIGGLNAQGKSSVLSAIIMGLGGGKAIVDQPVRRGEANGRVEIDLGEIIVERIFNASGGTKLVVKAAGGAIYPSPQAMLDVLVGKLSFDPLAFARAKVSEQSVVLRAVAGLDTKDLDVKRADAFARRTAVNGEVERLSKHFASIPEPSENTPDVLPDVPQLLQQLEQLRARNTGRQRKSTEAVAIGAKRAEAETALRTADALADRLASELEKARMEQQRRVAAIEQIEREHKTAKEAATAAIGEIESDADLLGRIKTSQTVSAQVTQKLERKKIHGEYAKACAHRDQLTDAIAAVDDEKAKRVAAAKFPVDGLSVTDEMVTFNGIPFSQASGAEQLRVSVAIGLALNPKLKVMVVRDGSLLDDEGLKLLAELAEAVGAQVWVERVGKGQEVNFLIEDGHVIEAPLAERKYKCTVCNDTGVLKGYADEATPDGYVYEPCKSCNTKGATA